MRINLCMGCMRERKEENAFCPYCGFHLTAYETSPHQLPLGMILKGQYLIGKVLGEGGFGITYIGYDLNLQMKVAVKEYFPSGFVTRSNSAGCSLTMLSGRRAELYEKGKNRFVEEARRLAKFFGLPGVVAVKDYFQENNTAYIVMEFAEGITLKELLKNEGGRMDASRVLEMMKPMMESLAKIHEAGMIHRDISPDNIMVDAHDNLKLIDFGAARSYIADDDQHSRSVLLKPGYSPEEQYRSRGNQGPWTDIYSLCATIYRAVTGQLPPEALDREKDDDVLPPSKLGARLSANTENAIMRGLSLNAENRYQSMQELMDDLYAPEDDRRRYPDKKDREDKKKSKRPLILAAGAAVAVILVGICVALVNLIPNPVNPAPETTEETTELTAEADGTEPTSDAETELTSAETAVTEATEASASGTVIEWADAGMEQCIRAALNRPEGDITSADVADIKVLRIISSKIIMLSDTAADPGDLNEAEGIESQTQLEGVEIVSLQDLKWMPKLEILQINNEKTTDISALSGLTNLRILDLGETGITDISALNGVTNLSEVDLSRTGISDISVLNGMENLSSLNLYYTGVTDISILEGMENLAYLVLNGTGVTDISVLSSLENLNDLFMGGAVGITDISPLSGLKNLVALHIGNTGVADISPLSGMENLTQLWLDEDNITDLSVLNSLPNLQYLNGEVYEAKTTIEWADAGMEQYIRAALNRPEGDITSADLADVKVLRLGGYEDGGKAVLFVNRDDDSGTLEEAEELSANSNLAGVEIKSLNDLKWMPKLEKLEIDGLDIEDISAIGELENLYWLEIHDTEITDISAVNGMKSLTGLFFYDNPGITDINALGGLENLTSLGLSGDFGITDISALRELKNLTWLNLGGTGVGDISALSEMTNLVELYLSDTGITDISALKKLQNLNKLSLYGTGITDISVLSEMTNLTELYLNDTGITDISALSKMENLTTLWLQNTGITDISALSGMTNMTYLCLYDNPGIADISALSGMENLTDLWLRNTGITDISALSGMTNMTSLYLNDNPGIADISALSGMENLTDLSLQNTGITDISALSKMKNLTTLWLDKEEITNLNLLNTLPNLQTLNGETYEAGSVE